VAKALAEGERQKEIEKRQIVQYETDREKIEAIYKQVEFHVKRAQEEAYSTVKAVRYTDSHTQISSLTIWGKDSTSKNITLSPVKNGFEVNFRGNFFLSDRDKHYYPYDGISEGLIVAWIRWVVEANIYVTTRKFRYWRLLNTIKDIFK